jgi:hypothetical protein
MVAMRSFIPQPVSRRVPTRCRLSRCRALRRLNQAGWIRFLRSGLKVSLSRHVEAAYWTQAGSATAGSWPAGWQQLGDNRAQ